MEFIVVAKSHGNQVEFSVLANSTKEALAMARAEAYEIFAYDAKAENAGEPPTVSVKPAKEPKESAQKVV